MTAMDVLVAEPGWQLARVVQLLPIRQDAAGEAEQRVPGGVGAPRRLPRVAYREAVHDKRWHEAAPHADGGMVLPGVRRPGERAQDLVGLHPLLAEARSVEDGGAGAEVGVGQERLHGSALPSRFTLR